MRLKWIVMNHNSLNTLMYCYSTAYIYATMISGCLDDWVSRQCVTIRPLMRRRLNSRNGQLISTYISLVKKVEVGWMRKFQLNESVWPYDNLGMSCASFVLTVIFTNRLAVLAANGRCFDVWSAVQNDTFMASHTYRKVGTASLYQCATECLMSSTCMSFRHKRHTCHLNSNNSAHVDVSTEVGSFFSDIHHWPQVKFLDVAVSIDFAICM